MLAIGRGVVPWMLALAMLLVFAGCRNSLSEADKSLATASAKSAYTKAKLDGTDFSNGPCIAEQLSNMLNWSADIAHSPRQAIDDKAENQCQFYRQGKTHHFVELDPDGNVIRVK